MDYVSPWAEGHAQRPSVLLVDRSTSMSSIFHSQTRAVNLIWLLFAIWISLAMGVCPVRATDSSIAIDAPVNWKANWVWPSLRNISPHTNQFVRFRKVFTLGSEPSAARVAIFADSRYQLFVNGELVGRGPARAPIYYGYYDVFDIARLLHAGKNVVAVEVRWFNAPMAWYRQLPGAPNHGGLLCQIELGSGESAQVIASDETWKSSEDESVRWGQPTINGALPEVEVVRGELAEPHWTLPEYDDKLWFASERTRTQFGLSVPPAEPFSHLERRPMAYPSESRIPPAHVVEAGATQERNYQPGIPGSGGSGGSMPVLATDLIDFGKFVAREPHDPQPGFLQNGLALTANGGRDLATVLAESGKTAYVILDMGSEVAGYPEITFEAPKGVRVDLAWSERLANRHVAADEPGGNYVARYFTRAGRQTWTLWGWHGFRFLELRFSDSSGPVSFRADVVLSTAALRHDGALETPNEALNRLWGMGAYTWQLSTLDGTMDTPTREQREWVGDGEVQLLVNSVANGNLDIGRKFLLDVARDQRQDGAIPSVVAHGYADTWVIDDYMFSFVNAAHRYYLETGDRKLLEEIYPNIIRTMNWFRSLQQSDGYLGAMPYWVFLDWSNPDKQGVSSILNALYVHAQENAAELADAMGDKQSAAWLRSNAIHIRNTWHERFWNPVRGLYVDATLNGKQSERVSQLANADAVLFQLAPKELVPAILQRITDTRTLKTQSLDATTLQLVQAKDLDFGRDVVQAQTYGMYFVLEALIRNGMEEKALSEIERLWGPMREAGNGTFWEQFNQANGTSCHAWSATPTYILTSVLLGVQPTAPGYSALTIAPRPSGLSWARGRVPTPRGTIEVKWKTRKQVASTSMEIEVKLPFDAHARLVMPKLEGRPARSVRLNGKLDKSEMLLERAGTYKIEIEY
jgi:hypothetical protein